MTLSNFRQKPIDKLVFYDKNGILIEPGVKITTNIDDQFKDCIIHDVDGKLGLFFKHGDYFIKLEKMLDKFFESVEVLKN